MISVSAGILQAQRDSAIIKRHVRYKKRYWDVDAQAFTWDSDWTELSSSEMGAPSRTREELDLQNLNEMRTSSITLTILNNDNVWDDTNPSGLFKRDSIARLGYLLYNTRFSVDVTYVYSDGTESEYVNLFDGYVSEINRYPGSRSVQLVVESMTSKLSNANAEAYSTTVTGEVIGTGDSTTTDFYTSHTSVGAVSAVYVDGVRQVLGTDYQVSNLSVYGSPATITFDSAPASASSITCDYSYWYVGKKIEDIVNALLTLAGIGTGADDREVAAVVSPNVAFLQKSKPNTADEIRYLAAQLPEADTPAWDNYESTGYATATVNPSAQSLTLAVGSMTTSGSKRWRRTVGDAGNGVLTHFAALVSVINSSATMTIAHETSANTLEAGIIYGSFGTGVAAVKFNGSTVYSTPYVPGVLHKFILYHIPGRYAVWIDGVNVVDTTYSAGTSVAPVVTFGGACGVISGSLPNNSVFYAIRVCGDWGTLTTTTLPLTGERVDTAYDLSGSVTTVSKLGSTYVNYEDTSISFMTASSNDGITYDAYMSVGAGGEVYSVPKRYLRVKTIRKTDSVWGYDFPQLQSYYVNYYINEALIRMVNCGGLTVLDAIRQLSTVASYEWGFTRSGKFFFRPRTSGTTVNMTLGNSDVLEIVNISSGHDRIYNLIEVAFGEYAAYVDCNVLRLPSPNSTDKYGVRRLSISSTNFLIGNDSNVALNAAYSYYALFANPKRLLNAYINFRPQIEIGDVLLFNVFDKHVDKHWHMGDTKNYIGQPTLQIYGHEQMSSFGISYRVVGISHDIDSGKSYVTCKEI